MTSTFRFDLAELAALAQAFELATAQLDAATRRLRTASADLSVLPATCAGEVANGIIDDLATLDDLRRRLSDRLADIRTRVDEVTHAEAPTPGPPPPPPRPVGPVRPPVMFGPVAAPSLPPGFVTGVIGGP